MDLKKDFFRKKIIIRGHDFLLDDKYIGNCACAKSWIWIIKRKWPTRQIVQRKMALVKSYVHNKYPKEYKGSDAEITMANNFILPEIAKQFGLETAEYYNVMFENCDILESEENLDRINGNIEKKIEPNKNYLLTPSFLGKNEELIHLEDVLDSKDNLKVSKMLKQITKYLKSEHVCEGDIENIKESFIKQCIFNKFVGFSDEHNVNTGIIFRKENRKKRVRLTPCYDLDFAIGVFNTVSDSIVPKYHFRRSDDEDIREATKLSSMLKQFDGDFQRRYVEFVLRHLDIEKAIEIGEKRGGFTLSELSREKYMNFLGKNILELQQYVGQYNRSEKTNNEDNER